MQICAPIAIEIRKILTGTCIRTSVYRASYLIPAERGSRQLCRVSAATIVKDRRITAELVNPNHVVGTVAVHITPANIGTI